MSEPSHVERREYPRFTLIPMYSPVLVQFGRGLRMTRREGHAYDISQSGARFELDEPLEVGQFVVMHLTLPGMNGTSAPITVSGRIVWVNDQDDDPGPRRMAVRFQAFRSPADRERLLQQFGSGGLPRAA